MTMKNIFEEIKKDRNTYRDMIDFCCDDLILNNEILGFYNSSQWDLEVFCGGNYDDENDEYREFFQFFIVSYSSADRLARYTNETVYYLPQIDMYLLAVDHFGTSWDCISANWKQEIND